MFCSITSKDVLLRISLGSIKRYQKAESQASVEKIAHRFNQVIRIPVYKSKTLWTFILHPWQSCKIIYFFLSYKNCLFDSPESVISALPRLSIFFRISHLFPFRLNKHIMWAIFWIFFKSRSIIDTHLKCLTSYLWFHFSVHSATFLKPWYFIFPSLLLSFLDE